MTMLDDWIASDAGTVYSALSKTVTFRRMVVTGGANPSSNPVTGAITVQTSATAGASTITLTSPTGAWFIEAGDTFTIAGNATVYTVGARVVSASGKFTNVAISPVLAANATAGAAVTVTWVNDYPAKAIVSGYDYKLIDGTTITVKDLRVLMQPTDTASRTISTPTPLDRIIIDGSSRAVGMSSPQYAGSVISLWDVQAKG